jgi:hypothetical protein
METAWRKTLLGCELFRAGFVIPAATRFELGGAPRLPIVRD